MLPAGVPKGKSNKYSAIDEIESNDFLKQTIAEHIDRGRKSIGGAMIR